MPNCNMQCDADPWSFAGCRQNNKESLTANSLFPKLTNHFNRQPECSKYFPHKIILLFSEKLQYIPKHTMTLEVIAKVF